MNEKDLAKELNRLERDFKTNIYRLSLLGFSKEEILKRCKKELEKRMNEVKELERYKSEIEASIMRWIKIAAPVYGIAAIAAKLQKDATIHRTPGKAIRIKLAPQESLTTNLPPKKMKEVMNYLSNLEATPTFGAPSIANYQKVLKETIKKLSGDPLSADKRLSVFAKAELDLRYDQQMTMLKEAQNSGQDLFWISSHADCSKRCERWQGKLVSLSLKSVNNKFETGHKVDGNTIYSLPDIINQVDKYGHKNNIIVGYNCRHTLIPWQAKSHSPGQYKSNRVKNYRELVAKQRQLERGIRKLKVELESAKLSDEKEAKKLRLKLTNARNNYHQFVRENSLVNQDWRYSF